MAWMAVLVMAVLGSECATVAAFAPSHSSLVGHAARGELCKYRRPVVPPQQRGLPREAAGAACSMAGENEGASGGSLEGMGEAWLQRKISVVCASTPNTHQPRSHTHTHTPTCIHH